MIQRAPSPLHNTLANEAYQLDVDARVHLPLVDTPDVMESDRAVALSPMQRSLLTPSRRPSPRIRPVRQSSISLAQRALEQGKPFISPEGRQSMTYRISKRVFDVVGAAALLILLSPVLLMVYLILMVTTRGKPLFTQQRLGYQGKPFTMLKFRTMTIDAEARRGEIENEKDGPIFKNRQDARVTRLGRVLRSTSLDETPQLINVLLGHMSLVGPRPPIGKEVAEYEPWQRRRLSVKPGLTCLWQVSGRSEIDFEDWMRMDLWYVRHQSWSTDLKFLVKTPWSVLTGRGAY